MKGWEILELMIKAIEEPVIKLDFNHFLFKHWDGYWVADAATNAILKLLSEEKRNKTLDNTKN